MMIKYIDINGKPTADEPYPPFQEDAINESKISPCMRFKEFGFTEEGIDWTTEEIWTPFDLAKFKTEVMRAYRAQGKFKGQEITINLEDRSGTMSDSFTILV